MKLFKWKSDFKPKFPDIIEKFFGKIISDKNQDNEEISTIPSVNISEADKVFEVDIAVPGINKKDIKIEVKNNCLVISSESQYSNEEKNKNWMRREYGYASFQRMFELPDNADPEKINASLKNGILNIKVGKDATKESKKRIINID